MFPNVSRLSARRPQAAGATIKASAGAFTISACSTSMRSRSSARTMPPPATRTSSG